MSYIYYRVMEYMEVHPIRFWAMVIGLCFLLAFTVYVLQKIITGYKNKPAEKFDQEDVTTETETQNEKHPLDFLNNNKLLTKVLIGQFIIILVLIATVFTFDNSIINNTENPSVSSSKYIFGIDVSHYQGRIDWREMRTSHHPIEFVFIRSTMGTDGKDKQFKKNWKKAKQHNYIRGAYHYYRPNENPIKQFKNYQSAVHLEAGDFLPVLDIEKESRSGRQKLRKNVLIWLKLAEEEYDVKPIVYTGLKFYKDILKGYVDDYPLWIAAYSGKHRLKGVNWSFHQFTERVRIKGVRASVDGNDFKGDSTELNQLRINYSKAQ